jgi:hypothetical protein
VAVASREELLASLTSIQLGVEDGSLTQLSVGAVERQCVSLMQVRHPEAYRPECCAHIWQGHGYRRASPA